MEAYVAAQRRCVKLKLLNAAGLFISSRSPKNFRGNDAAIKIIFKNDDDMREFNKNS